MVWLILHMLWQYILFPVFDHIKKDITGTRQVVNTIFTVLKLNQSRSLKKSSITIRRSKFSLGDKILRMKMSITKWQVWWEKLSLIFMWLLASPWQILDKHTIVDTFWSKCTSHCISYLRFRLQCNITLRNPNQH